MDFPRKTATVGGLVLLACLIQVWTIARAVVPAQDCVRYLIVAQSFERDGFAATMRVQPEQPLFPWFGWLVHRTLVAAGAIDVENWAICLQLAAAIPLVGSVTPVHALFRRLHGEKAALVGAALYCLLGGIARLGADGLSDSTHLALVCTALWAATRYFCVPRPSASYASPLWLSLCGGLTGLALTSRGESLVLPAALIAALAWLQIARGHRQNWIAAARAVACYSCGLAALLVPYLVGCGAGTADAALSRLTGRGGAAEAAPLNSFVAGIEPAAVEPRWELAGTGRLVFGKKDTSTTSRFQGYLAAAARLFHELAQTMHYWLGVLALIGLAAARRTLVMPLDRFMQCLCAALVAAGLFVAARAGYLSTRHMLLLVVLGVGWAGAGALVVATWLAAVLPRSVLGAAWPRSAMPLRMVLPVAMPLCVVLLCSADCFAPLHASRGAHREAARWLTENADRSVAVLDSRGWTALYTGRKTYRYEAAQAAFSDPALAFVVVEQAELAADSRRSETMRLLMSHAGEPVARFAAAGSDKHSVVIHRWRPERFQELGVQSYAR
ncbi:MAG TPA: hypothetical protein VHC22_26610 [Pirellulales bacterium]|nr:hypothetical protein [Pirellulales bacterium]